MTLQEYPSFESYPHDVGRTVVTIGNFDGVHCGHQQILRIARAAADGVGARVAVVTFDPHPARILHPTRSSARLTTRATKKELFGRNRVDDIIVLQTDEALLALSAAEFLGQVVEHLKPLQFVEGPDFHFGRGRAGSLDTLREHAARYDYRVVEVPPTRIPELPDLPRASSSAARRLLMEGRVCDAALVLGRPHGVVGHVRHGEGRGAPMGIATANLEDIPQVLPGVGVYATLAKLRDGRIFPAAVNVGPQPTFQESTFRVEAHLIGFAEDLRENQVALYFLERLRGQTAFASQDELVAQIREDIERTVEVCQTSSRQDELISMSLAGDFDPTEK